ncbi:MAG TPA: DUF1194 domain-containing protein [Stellaceae bacterium]|nr:DUF1194 domain-containing protein [Stellaceae bacterium]
MSAVTRLLCVAALIVAVISAWTSAAEAQAEKADLALVLAVDVSGSVTEERFALQMEGIARAFEDPAVQAAILAGPHRAIFATLVEWSDRTTEVVPWRLIASADDARAFATSVRQAPRADDQFTCMAAALNVISGKVLPFLPAPAQRTIVDVSGDGHDNCNPATNVDSVRDALVASGVTINGLPILEGDEATTLESWYRDHVVGGPDAFLAPALGFKDFGRAMRRKFLVEISSAHPAPLGG